MHTGTVLEPRSSARAAPFWHPCRCSRGVAADLAGNILRTQDDGELRWEVRYNLILIQVPHRCTTSEALIVYGAKLKVDL